MRGRWHNGADKWPHINQIIKDKKIDILTLQETHLTKEDADTLNTTPGLRIHVIPSIDPARTNAKGVALVVNKRLLGIADIKNHELIPGRAILTIIPWHKDKALKVLTVYAPNDGQANHHFWELIRTKIRNLPKPDVMLGDFNVVEDPLDRLPPKSDHINASNSLHQLRSHLQLQDGWRHENQDTLSYTFSQSAFQGGSQSRIDRIYIKPEYAPFNHQMVSVRISCKQMPYVGSGRWSLPLHVLKDKTLGEEILSLGKTLQTEIKQCKNHRTEEMNPQIAFSCFKTKAISLCRTTARKTIPKKINKLKSQLKDTMTDLKLSEEDRRIVGLHI
ncbi:DNase I-like protein [Suillus brevipes Sb2]|nr:DNase I-like protein [Suillus brevipes Sb2]